VRTALIEVCMNDTFMSRNGPFDIPAAVFAEFFIYVHYHIAYVHV
jgi:hypothetical protein